ncbi:MAG: carbohydrate ABC transporter permease [Clostridia bacterium]|nr:carbohydrate ABC transporter permease [Clostridia bacterium]
MKKRITIGDIIIAAVMIAWGFTIFYPFYNTVLTSFMTEAEFLKNPFSFYVKDITFDAYKEILSNNKIPRGFLNSLIIVAGYTPLSVILVSTAGYAMSRKKFPLRNIINNYFVMPMYFSGGIIPLYLLVKNLGMLNSLWPIILLDAMNLYNMILVKNYFYGIPDSLEESARIDGANDIRICFQIYMPLAKPILATILLFCVVNKWNEWYNPLLFITNTKQWPLQLVLREIIGEAAERLETGGISEELLGLETFSQSIKMATVVVTMVPIMCVYPFLQKYFIKGIMIGAVKG